MPCCLRERRKLHFGVAFGPSLKRKKCNKRKSSIKADKGESLTAFHKRAYLDKRGNFYQKGKGPLDLGRSVRETI